MSTHHPLCELTATPYLKIIGARDHNLANINVAIRRGTFTVLTGPSGCGKSSLLSTIIKEAERRYLPTLENSSFARHFMGSCERPDLDKITGLQPIISIGQETHNRHNLRSTIGTFTGLSAFLRLLYARAATPHSYLSSAPMIRQSTDQIQQRLFSDFRNKTLTFFAPLVRGRKGHYRELFRRLCKMGFTRVRVDGIVREIWPNMQLDRYRTHSIAVVVGSVVIDLKDKQFLRDILQETFSLGKGDIIIHVEEERKTYHFSKNFMDPTTGLSYPPPSPNTFSFNSPYGFCSQCQGYGKMLSIAPTTLIPDPKRNIAEGGIAPLGPQRATPLFKAIDRQLTRAGYDISTPIKELPPKLLSKIIHGSKGKEALPLNGELDKNSILSRILKGPQRHNISPYTITCSQCEGARLSQEALHYYLGGHNIATLTAMPLSQLQQWLHQIEERLDKRQRLIAKEILKEMHRRLALLLDMDLGYLQLDRPLQTLSGGEIQRIRLATQIGSDLVGILYLLDEPSIGLHQRDNQHLIDALKKLRDLGNTVVVIEHDEETMLQADYLIDLGPGAGRHGGKLVAEGTPSAFLKHKSLTADYLTGKRTITLPDQRRTEEKGWLTIRGCQGHNLKKITLSLPLGGKIVGITGVSGSGKTTLIHHTLLPLLQRHLLGNHHRKPLAYSHAKGLEYIDKVVTVDQTPIGRTPRSNPATYTDIFGHIRTLYAELPLAKVRGYKPGQFSFNLKGGRCEKCQGAGIILLTMGLLPNARIPCDACRTKRYTRETLEITYRGKSIADILDMSIDEAITFFENHKAIQQKLQTFHAVGLDYLTLGQHATTLSGGEAQRLKLVNELARKQTGKTLYIFDEPTRGLHFHDIVKLLAIFEQLATKGNTVLVLEHNLDIIKMADHVIDLGPEAGERGGEIIAAGTPEQIAAIAKSHTGRFLKPLLKRKQR